MERQPIKQRKKKCKECSKEDYLFSDGMCKSCAYKYRYGGIERQPIIRRFKPRRVGVRLEVYFDYHIYNCKRSEESGVSIQNPTKANICHLFDKARHPSLSAELHNFVYLTIEEHANFDNLLYTHQFDKLEEKFKNSWPIACKRISELLPLCEEQTKFKTKIKAY